MALLEFGEKLLEVVLEKNYNLQGSKPLSKSLSGMEGA